MTVEAKTCQNCQQSFRIEPEDFAFYEKIGVPPPTWCPECRLIRRLAFRNERNLYANTCALCGKDIISIFHRGSGFSIYCQLCWWSDKWDSLDYGQEYNFSKPFFTQFATLMKRVPMPAFIGDYATLINSPYINMASDSKNCYLTSHADHNEDCAYAAGLKLSKDVYDTTMVQQSELSYEVVNVVKGFKNFFSVDCENCHDIYFSRNLEGCSHCIGCVNLRNKSYHIFNEPYTKENYEKKLTSMDLGSYEGLMRCRAEAIKRWNIFPQKNYHGTHNINVTGDYIYYSRNVRSSYEMVGVENAAFSQFLSTKPSEDVYDYTEWGQGASLIYEAVVCGIQIASIKFCWSVDSGSYDVAYSILSSNLRNSFGSAGLRNKEFCILNRQYTREEYQKFLSRIKRHMDKMPYGDARGRIYAYGEFFPSEISPFAYNETAQEFFPLSKEDAIAQGFRWKEPEKRNYTGILFNDTLSDHIKDVADDILDHPIECGHKQKCSHGCTQAFRLIPSELMFLRNVNLPLPRLCPNCRHHERIKYRNPMKFWKRTCQCAGNSSENGVYKNTGVHAHHGIGEHCPNEFETSYSPDRSEIVYCEPCYQAEMI